MKEYLIQTTLPNGQSYSAMRQTEEDVFADMLNALTADCEEKAEASVQYAEGVPVIISRDIELPEFRLVIRDGDDYSTDCNFKGYNVARWTLKRIMRFCKLHA